MEFGLDLWMEGGIQTHERHRETGTGDMNTEDRRSNAKTNMSVKTDRTRESDRVKNEKDMENNI